MAQREIAVIVALLVLQYGLVQADYILQVRIHSYSNPTSRLADGECCAGRERMGRCNRECNNIIAFCLREAGFPETLQLQCPLGLLQTSSSQPIPDEIVLDQRLPVTFSDTRPLPGSFQLYILVRDVGGFEEVDVFYIEDSLLPRPNATDDELYVGDNGNSMIRLSFLLMCSNNFYDPNCTTFCKPRDDASGHYVCNSNGEMVCLAGYTNTAANCTECVPTSGCVPQQGYCDSIPGECVCFDGFTGNLCENLIDPCTRTPCHNGGSCINTRNGEYMCSCLSGYGGRNCEEEEAANVSICSSSPCQNGGSCINTRNGDYMCSCLSGYGGRNCEEEEANVSICSSSPCQNGGSCINTRNGDYMCSCLSGYGGRNCEEEEEANVSICSSSPCQNGGSCLELMNRFQCQCVQGYTGQFCGQEGDMNVGNRTTQDGSNAGMVGGVVAGVLSVVLFVATAVVVGILIWKKQLISWGSKSLPEATLPGDNPVYETDLQPDKLPATSITTIEDYHSLQNPLYETPAPASSHLTTNGLNPYGDFGDSTLQRVASNINVVTSQPESLFDETEYEFVKALP